MQRSGAAVGGDGESVSIPGGKFLLKGDTVRAKGMIRTTQRGENILFIYICDRRPWVECVARNYWFATKDGQLACHATLLPRYVSNHSGLITGIVARLKMEYS